MPPHSAAPQDRSRLCCPLKLGPPWRLRRARSRLPQSAVEHNTQEGAGAHGMSWDQSVVLHRPSAKRCSLAAVEHLHVAISRVLEQEEVVAHLQAV